MLTFSTKKRNSFPSLVESSILRYFTFGALYFAQGIPQGFLWYAVPAWLASNGKTPLEIGSFIAVIGLPWSFKILAAPVMDRYSYLPMGRRKPWILFGQMGLVISFFSLAFVTNPINNMYLLMVLGFIINFFGVFQDVGVDSLAIDILPENEQARANGLMWGSKTIGISITVALGTWMINQYGFSTSIMWLAVIVFIIMIVPLILKERTCEKRFPWSNGETSNAVLGNQLDNWMTIFKSLFKVFMTPTSLMMGILAFSVSICRGSMDALLPVFTVQELGWTDIAYSQVFSTSTLISGLLGLLVAGALIDFFGKIKMMALYLIALILILMTMTILQSNWNNEKFVWAFVACYYIFDTFTTIGLFAIAMHLCWKRVAASQFTLYMAISNIGLSIGAWFMGIISSSFNWNYVFISNIIFIIIPLLLLKFINFKQHNLSIKRLDES